MRGVDVGWWSERATIHSIRTKIVRIDRDQNVVFHFSIRLSNAQASVPPSLAFGIY